MRDISVVIPTFNSSRTIVACLKSIHNQTSQCHEVLVVDRFSGDGTAAIAKALGATTIQAKANRSLARNIGLEVSASSNVLFVDSDMILSPTVIEECSECLDDHDAVLIPEVSIGSGFWAKCKQLERGASSVEAARSFRKHALVSIGKYNSTLEVAEDLDLQTRAIASGLAIGTISATILHDEGNLSMFSSMRKKFLYAKTFRNYLRTNPNAGFRLINPARGIVLPAMHVLASAPKYGPGILTMKTLEWTAALFGYVFAKTSYPGLSRGHDPD
jgi:glycosyltransferase involved in cell wall biosynthesis